MTIPIISAYLPDKWLIETEFHFKVWWNHRIVKIMWFSNEVIIYYHIEDQNVGKRYFCKPWIVCVCVSMNWNFYLCETVNDVFVYVTLSGSEGNNVFSTSTIIMFIPQTYYVSHGEVLLINWSESESEEP